MSKCRVFLAAWIFLLSFSAQAQEQTKPLNVVASFSVIGDMVRQIGGEDVRVSVLIGPEQDPHAFRPSPKDVQMLAVSDIIAINGLHFEGWIGRLIEASGTKAKLLVASAGVTPILTKTPHAHEEMSLDRKHEEERVDPHAWQNPSNGRLYVRAIAGALIESRPERKEAFLSRARVLDGELKALDAHAHSVLDGVPEEKRKLVTAHPAFGYLGRAYGIEMLSPIASANESEPSAFDIAALIRKMKEENIKIVFKEAGASSRLIEQIAHEADARVGGVLYADALSESDGPAATYLAMLRHNIAVILAAF